MPAIGFYDPVMFIRIADQHGIVRRFSADSVVTEQGAKGRFLQSVSITETLAGNTKIEIILAPPYDAMIELLESDLLAYGNVMEVQWGYASTGLRKVFGILTMPDVELERTATLTINADGLLFGLMRGGEQWTWKEDPNNNESANIPPLEIIITVAERMGFSGNKFQPNLSTSVYDKMSAVPTDAKSQTTSDWQFIQQLAADYGAYLYVEDGYILKLTDYTSMFDPSAQYVATFRYWGQLDTARNIYPLLRFSTDMAGMITSLRSQGIFAKGTNPDDPTIPANSPATQGAPAGQTQIVANNVNKVPVDQYATQATTLAGPLPVAAAPGAAFPELQGIQLSRLSLTAPGKQVAASERDVDAPTRLQAEFDNAKIDILQAEIETLGIPRLYPTMLVKVEGVSRMYNGVYAVKEVTHEIGEGGYTMRCQLTTPSFGIQSVFANPVTATVSRAAKEQSILEH